MISCMHIGSIAAAVKTAIGETDPYWSNVSNLLHFNGSNNSTTFTDEKSTTWTSIGAIISTTTSMFGGGSGYFNGTSAYIYASSKPVFGLNNFTVEFNFYQIPGGPSTQYICCVYGILNNQRSWGIPITDTGNIYAFLSTTGSSANIQINGGAVTQSTWHHCALVRNGVVFTLYIDGVSVGSTSNSDSLFNSTSPLIVGKEDTASWFFNGYIDELRITNGVARYTSSFTQPASQFPDG